MCLFYSQGKINDLILGVNIFLSLEQTSEARKKVYKAIVETRPPVLDFIHAATQVSSSWIEVVHKAKHVT